MNHDKPKQPKTRKREPKRDLGLTKTTQNKSNQLIMSQNNPKIVKMSQNEPKLTVNDPKRSQNESKNPKQAKAI